MKLVSPLDSVEFLFRPRLQGTKFKLIHYRELPHLAGESPDLYSRKSGVLMERQVAGYRWIVRDPEKFGGKPIVSGTRFTVSFLLACLSEGMSYEEIIHDYSDFPRESLSEILRFASEVTDHPDVAA